jgi:hypothetical protein
MDGIGQPAWTTALLAAEIAQHFHLIGRKRMPAPARRWSSVAG